MNVPHDKQGTILCIDNNAESRQAIAGILSTHTLTFAANAFEAIRAVNARSFHAYILDYWLPDWSGVQLCRAIRDVDPYGPIVFCSTAARDEDRKRALRAGANAFIGKPIDAERLRRQLRVQLELSELHSTRAKIEEERAVQNELDRRLGQALATTATARELAAASIERTARTKAYKAFIDARGSRAHFESWWPNLFVSARASRDVGDDERSVRH